MSVAIRPARVEDVEDMRALVNRYAAEDRMLERSREVAEGLGEVGDAALAGAF